MKVLYFPRKLIGITQAYYYFKLTGSVNILFGFYKRFLC